MHLLPDSTYAESLAYIRDTWVRRWMTGAFPPPTLRVGSWRGFFGIGFGWCSVGWFLLLVSFRRIVRMGDGCVREVNRLDVWFPVNVACV